MSEILPYDPIKRISDVPEIVGKYCYVLEPYADSGYSVLASSENDEFSFKFGNFDGTVIDPLKHHKLEEHIKNCLFNNVNNILKLLKLVKVPQCQIYFCEGVGEKIVIGDVRTYFDKFLSPGMIRDVISKAIGIDGPIIKSIEVITEEFIKNNKNAVIKPSSPLMVVRGESVMPLRARI